MTPPHAATTACSASFHSLEIVAVRGRLKSAAVVTRHTVIRRRLVELVVVVVLGVLISSKQRQAVGRSQTRFHDRRTPAAVRHRAKRLHTRGRGAAAAAVGYYGREGRRQTGVRRVWESRPPVASGGWVPEGPPGCGALTLAVEHFIKMFGHHLLRRQNNR